MGKRVATFLGKGCQHCFSSVRFVAIGLYLSVFSFLCWELHVDLIISASEFTHLLSTYACSSCKKTYSRTLMAWTPFELCQFVLEMGSSSQWDLTLSCQISYYMSFYFFYYFFFFFFFFFYKLSIGKQFICKAERQNCKQHWSWWDGSSGSTLFSKA